MSQYDSLNVHWERWCKAQDARTRWTREAWIDLRFESGKSWSDDELAIFRAQNRAPSNYNLIRPMINLVCGIEAQTRSDLLVLPRTSRTRDSADALTKLSKYVSDQNKTDRHLSQAFKDAARLGVGWLETGYNPDPRAEKILQRRENPFNVWLDPACQESDLSDACDVFRAKWLYPHYLAMLFPQLRGQIPGTSGINYDALSHSADYTNTHNDRPPVALFNGGYGGDAAWGPGMGMSLGVSSYTQEDTPYQVNRFDGLMQAVERWYRCDELATFARFRNGVVLESTPQNAKAIAAGMVAGEVTLIRSIAKRVRVAIFVEGMLLQDSPSPYDHGELPFIPIWAYEDEDGVPMGLVRSVRDPQKEFNARRTHLLKRALARQVHYEEGAFVDEDDALQELARHDGAVKYTQGALRGGAVKVRDDLQSSQVDAELLAGAQKMVQDQSGTTAELLGQETNASSGKAIQSRQAQGQTALYTLFDNRNWAQIQMGEQTLSLIQSGYTDEMEVRITGTNSSLKFVTVNQQQPDGTVVNDITQGRFDVVISQAPSSPTERAARAERMGDFLAKLNLPPEVLIQFAPDLAELDDLPADFIEKMSGIVEKMMGAAQGPPPGPPGPPPTEPTPPPGAQMPPGFALPPEMAG